MVLPYSAGQRNIPLVLSITLVLQDAFTGTLGLRLLSLEVPPVVNRGDSVWLNCTLDMEMDELYSVKWYKNDVEFYRYLPRDSPSGQTYNVPGIFVNLKKSAQSSVYMQTTDLDSEGMYRCEASAESPTFQTVEGQKYMTVYVLPKEGPFILGTQNRHIAGDTINATCNSAPSKPAADITWYINGRKAPQEYMTDTVVVNLTDGLYSSSRGIRFIKDSYQTRTGAGAINLRCVVTVSQSYSMSSEEVIANDKALEKQSSGTNLPLISQLYNHDGPQISGGRRRYTAGDMLNMNCSSSKSQLAPELQWFLNSEEVSDINIIRYPTTIYADGRESTTLGLYIRVLPKHFDEHGVMRVRCTETLSEVVHTRSDEKTVGGNHRNSGLQVAENISKVLHRSSGADSRSVVVLLPLLGLISIV